MIKTIRVFNQESDWNSKAINNTVLAFNLDDSKEIGTITFEKISGPDIKIESFIDLIAYDLDILKHITKYVCDYNRKHNFFIKRKEGQSGCIDLSLYENYNKFSVAKNSDYRAGLHISCFGKIDVNTIKDMWIGDLIELVLEYDPDEVYSLLQYVIINNSKKGIKKTRNKIFKYLKNVPPKNKISIEDLLLTDEYYGDEEISYTTKNGTYIYEAENNYMRPISELDNEGIKIHKISSFLNDDKNPMHLICVEYEGQFYKVEYNNTDGYIIEKSKSDKLPYPWSDKHDSFAINTKEHSEVYVYLNHQNTEYLHVRFKNNKLELSFVNICEIDGGYGIGLYNNFYYIDNKGRVKNMKENEKFICQMENEFSNTFDKNDLIY